MAKKIEAWSLSRWATYNECPRRAKYLYVEKRKVPEEKRSPALVRGQEIHEAAEFYVRGHQKKLHSEISRKLKKGLDGLRAGYKKGLVKTEYDVAFTRKWRPTGWFDSDAWLRVKADALSLLIKKLLKIIDYKSGRLKEEHSVYDEQLELYALSGLLLFPEVEATEGQLWFTDHGKVLTRPAGKRTREELSELKEKWEDAVAPMLRDTRFAPRPGYYCRYCPFSMNRGGPCEF